MSQYDIRIVIMSQYDMRIVTQCFVHTASQYEQSIVLLYAYHIVKFLQIQSFQTNLRLLGFR